MKTSLAHPLTAWIDLTNPEMKTWVYSYLVKKNILFAIPNYASEDHSTIIMDQLQEFIRDDTSTADRELLVRKMKTAWRQKEFRKSKKRKNESQYSFTLPIKNSRMLTTLAKRKGLSRSDTIKALIEAEYRSDQVIKRNNQNEQANPQYSVPTLGHTPNTAIDAAPPPQQRTNSNNMIDGSHESEQQLLYRLREESRVKY